MPFRNRRGGLVFNASASYAVGVGLNPSHDRPNSLKLVVMAFPLGTQGYGNSTTTGPPVSG